MNFNHRPSKVLITGKSGSGKTTLWLSRLKASRHRWKWVFDPDGEASIKTGWPLAVATNQLEAATARRQPVCYDPSRDFPGNRQAGFEFFCRWCFSVAEVLRGPKLLAVDEVWRYVPQGQPIGQPVQILLDEGRKQEIDLLLVAQRPNRVHDGIRAVLTELVTFQHTDRLPLSWLAEDFDPEAVKALKCPGGYLAKQL